MTKDDSSVSNKLELWLTPLQQNLLADILASSWTYYFAKAKGMEKEAQRLRHSYFKGIARQG